MHRFHHLLGIPENLDAHRYVSLGGSPFQIDGAGSNSAWFYLNHPKLNNQPQWELALSSRKSLGDVKREDLLCRFYQMGDPDGTATFGSDWRGHAVRIPEGGVAFVRPMTNHSVSYAVELLRVDRGRGVRPRVEARYMQMAHPAGPANGNQPIHGVPNSTSSAAGSGR